MLRWCSHSLVEDAGAAALHRAHFVMPLQCKPNLTEPWLVRELMSVRFDRTVHPFFVNHRAPVFALGSPRADHSYSPSRPIAFHFSAGAVVESDTLTVQIGNVTVLAQSLRGTFDTVGNSIIRQYIGPQSFGEHQFSLILRQDDGRVIIEHSFVLTVTSTQPPAPVPFGYSSSLRLPSPARTESLTNVCFTASFQLMFWPDPLRYTYPPLAPLEDLNPQVREQRVSTTTACSCPPSFRSLVWGPRAPRQASTVQATCKSRRAFTGANTSSGVVTQSRPHREARDFYVASRRGLVTWGATFYAAHSQGALRLARWSDAILPRSVDEVQEQAVAAQLVILSSPNDLGFGHVMLDDMYVPKR